MCFQWQHMAFRWNPAGCTKKRVPFLLGLFSWSVFVKDSNGEREMLLWVFVFA